MSRSGALLCEPVNVFASAALRDHLGQAISQAALPKDAELLSRHMQDQLYFLQVSRTFGHVYVHLQSRKGADACPSTSCDSLVYVPLSDESTP